MTFIVRNDTHDNVDYQRLTAAGKLGEAGMKLDALKGVLDRLKAHSK
jgi:uncharacterized protein